MDIFREELEIAAEDIVRTCVADTAAHKNGGRYGMARKATPFHVHQGGRAFRIEITVADANGRMPMDDCDRIAKRLEAAGAPLRDDVFLARLVNLLADPRADIERAFIETLAALSKANMDLRKRCIDLLSERTTISDELKAELVTTMAQAGK